MRSFLQNTSETTEPDRPFGVPCVLVAVAAVEKRMRVLEEGHPFGPPMVVEHTPEWIPTATDRRLG